MKKNQLWFNGEYPRNKDEIEVKYEEFWGKLDIENYRELKNLCLQNIESIDEVTLRNLTKLEECTIWDCSIKNLVIENCPKIRELNVRNNLLDNLGFLNSKSLRGSVRLDLDISNNNFPRSELEALGGITNLRELNVSNSGWRKALRNEYNRFHKSLKYLKNNEKLELLDISNTDVDRGLKLEYIPESLERVKCSNDLVVTLFRKENKCSMIAQELREYRLTGGYYSLERWRNGNINRGNITWNINNQNNNQSVVGTEGNVNVKSFTPSQEIPPKK